MKTITIEKNSNNIPTIFNFEHWKTVPSSIDEWNNVDGQGDFEEPKLNNPNNKKIASGTIIIEDNKIWVFHPTNEFAGIKASFPKGKLDKGLNLRANAIKETYEETGFKVKLIGYAIDSDRTTSFTRYYYAERIGGHPKDMGWEAQAVSLIPKENLKNHLNSPLDHNIVDKLFT